MSVQQMVASVSEPIVFNFAEECCFTKEEQLRQDRAPVVFRLYSIGKRLGLKLDADLVADYGVYYDPDNSQLIAVLAAVAPTVNWNRYVFWCRPDQTRIAIIDPDDDRTVAHLETRKYHGKVVSSAKVDAGEYGPDVISFDECVRRQAARRSGEEQAGE